jgi:hypothetical protein
MVLQHVTQRYTRSDVSLLDCEEGLAEDVRVLFRVVK